MEARKQAFKEHISRDLKALPDSALAVDQVCGCVKVVTSLNEDFQLPVIRDYFNQRQIDACEWAFAEWRKTALSNPLRERLVDSMCRRCDGTGLDLRPKPKYLVYVGAQRVTDKGYRRLITNRRNAAFLGLVWRDFDDVCTAYGVDRDECVRYSAAAHKPDFKGLVVLLPQVAGKASKVNFRHVYEA